MYVEIEIDARKNENRFFIGRAKYLFDISGACNIENIYIYIFEGKRGSCRLARFLACVSGRSIDHRRSVIRRELKKKKKKCARKGRRMYIYIIVTRL